MTLFIFYYLYFTSI